MSATDVGCLEGLEIVNIKREKRLKCLFASKCPSTGGSEQVIQQFVVITLTLR